MAECIECKKGWNSWGSGDNFCCENCEISYINHFKPIIFSFIESLNKTQKDLFKKIIELNDLSYFDASKDGLQKFMERLLKEK